MYGFCPAKVTWDPFTARLFRLLLISSETGVMIEEGSLSEQPDWWIDLLGWFIPKYDNIKFSQKAKSILGDGKNKSTLQQAVKTHGRNNR